MEYIKLTIAAIIMLMGLWLGADILFEEKSKKDIVGIILVIAGSLLIGLFNMNKMVSELGFAKIIIIFIMMTLFFKNKYRIKISDSLIGSVILYANVLISELSVEIVISILDKTLNINALTIIQSNIMASTIITMLSMIVLKILKKKYLRLYKKIQNYDSILVGVILLVFAILLVISGIIPLKNLDLGMEMLIVALLMIGFFVIGIYIIFEKIERQKEMEKYTQLSEYSKVNEGLLEDYRVSCHENRNHLIIIDNMIPKRNKKVHEYIHSIINNRKMNKYYFINELKNIPITELKGFINFKAMEMINDDINLQINISPEMQKSKLKDLTLKEKENLYNIIGVLMDNAYEAAKETEEKEVVLHMYKDDDTVVIVIANTYQGEININKVSEYRYSSKGKNHGTGLYIVEKIINKNEIFEKETSLMDNYFIQSIKIK